MSNKNEKTAERVKRQTEELIYRTINSNKHYIHALNELYSNNWNVWVSISSVNNIPATTIKQKLQKTLTANGFSASSYKMLAVDKGTRLYGYIEVLPDEDGYIPVAEFIDIVKSVRGLYSIECFKHEPTAQAVDIVKNCKPSEILRTNNTVKTGIDFEQIIRAFVVAFMDKRARNSNYTQNYEFTGTVALKKVRFMPQINSNGNGYVWFFVDEHENGALTHQFFGAVVISNRKPALYDGKDMFYVSSMGNKSLFVYAVIRKSDGEIVYIGYTRTIETRPKRHFSPTESYGNNTSVPFNYDFHVKYGNLAVNDGTKEIFKNHKLDWNEYDIRFLPLTHYDVHVNIESAHNKSLLPEAYIMDAIEKEAPDKIVRSDAGMKFFCSKIENKTHGVPLWHCTADANNTQGSHNVNKLQVERLLKKYADIVETGAFLIHPANEPYDFDSILRVTLELATGENLHGVSWYDIFTQHALNLEQAMRYAVGLNINKTPAPHKTEIEQHKEDTVAYLLKRANYKEV